MNKKYYIIAILSILIVLIGVTVAYWIAIVTGEGENITVTVDNKRRMDKNKNIYSRKSK